MLLHNSAAVFFGVYGVYAMEFKAYYKTEDNSKLHEAQFKKIKYGNAVVVALDITTGMPLDSDCGAVIDIDFDERVVEYSANYLSGEYWCKIFFGRELKDLPYNTQLMTYKKPSGDFGIILPIVSDKYKCVLRGAENSVEAVLFSWAKGLTECHAPAFVYSEGKNPFGMIKECTYAAMEESVGKYFANNLINCMGMAAEDIWNRPQSAVSRCSGDFMPENNSWFVGHILQCAYNSFMLSPLYYCDYDMWWTDDEQALKNCVLHAVSGGPVYISDKIGRSRPDVLYPLCLDDGRILRCDRPGMPAADCLTNNPADQGRALVIQNVCRGTGVMALFNLSVDNYCVSSKISPCQIDGLSGEKFLFFEFFSKDYFILGYNEWKDVTVNSSNDIKLYNIVALNDDFTPIGISEKMLAARTFGISDDGEIEFYTSGTFIFYKNDTVCRYSVDKDEKYLVRDFMQTEI